MKKRISMLLIAALFTLCAGCGNAPEAGREEAAPAPETTASAPETTTAPEKESPAAPEQSEEAQDRSDETEEANMEKPLRLAVGGTELSVAWESNESVEALAELAGTETLTVEMSMYGGFEQVGPLGTSLPRDDLQTNTQAGDIVLYSGNQIVIFYGSNSWAYTRLGRITDKSAAELTELLGNGGVVVTLYR